MFGEKGCVAMQNAMHDVKWAAISVWAEGHKQAKRVAAPLMRRSSREGRRRAASAFADRLLRNLHERHVLCDTAAPGVTVQPASAAPVHCMSAACPSLTARAISVGR